ncbi:MAG: EAL domain-containing protein [Lachnospiraceae bacterium]
MNSPKDFSHKDKKIQFMIVLLFSIVCISVGILCFQYYKALQHTVKAETSSYMQEISKQMGTNVSATINNNFFTLETLSVMLQHTPMTSYEEFTSVVQNQQLNWDFQNILLIDSNGTAYDSKGKITTLENAAYLQETIVNKRPSMSSSQSINSIDSIIFTIPIDNFMIDNTPMVALAATYDVSTFDKILSMTAFNGKGYAHITHPDGTSIIRSSSKNALETGYNILNSIAGSDADMQTQVQKVKSDLANGEDGQIEFTLGSAHEYLTYTPLNADEWCLLTFVPVSVVNEKSQLFLHITLLLCSVVTVAFSLLTISLAWTFFRNKRRLEHIAYVDTITGGNTAQRFYELADNIMKNPNQKKYALIYSNIEKFKVLNEQFGTKACDNILHGISFGIQNNLSSHECMGRLFADNFCILIEYINDSELEKRLQIWYHSSTDYVEEKHHRWLPLNLEFGVYLIGSEALTIPAMIDCAKLALTETVQELHGKLRYAIFNEQVRQLLFREKQLEDMMEDSLNNNEFQVYLQPKYLTQNESIGGAEALVRWNNPSEGMIYPDEFISLFEKNGFIIRLDLWVFQEVCKTLRKWLDEGYEPIKISVNCSRIHLKNPDFLSPYQKIIEKYNIPPHFIEIELTETAVFEDVEHFTHTIDHIHAIGFGCSMDDFGSGYSSLNLIQYIPVDTLKIDKIFFRNGTTDLQRTESILGSIITMAKALSMKTVAEGVEHLQQVTMLRRLNCDYIQGYYFARPMPINEFEQLFFQKK